MCVIHMTWEDGHGNSALGDGRRPVCGLLRGDAGTDGDGRAMSDRRGMGLDIAKSNSISENADGSFSVPSQTRRGTLYTVKVIGDAWTCDCPDFVNRFGEIDECKHILAVKFWTAAQVELSERPKPKVFAEDASQCPICGSIRVVKYGRTNAKQVFKCRDCGKKFREGLLKKSRYSPETISLTLDLYF